MAVDNKYIISIITNKDSWMYDYVIELKNVFVSYGHSVACTFDVQEIQKGDFAFYLSCEQIATPLVLSRNKHNLVVHPSALPKGRGWSPLAWQILEGKNQIPITLFEAEEKVDRGDIYLQEVINFRGDELIDELRKKQGEASIRMCMEFVNKYPTILQQKIVQSGERTYYRRRYPADNELDPKKNIDEQFNLLRIADNEKYPVHYKRDGQTYILKIYRKQNNG